MSVGGMIFKSKHRFTFILENNRTRARVSNGGWRVQFSSIWHRRVRSRAPRLPRKNTAQSPVAPPTAARGAVRFSTPNGWEGNRMYGDARVWIAPRTRRRRTLPPPPLVEQGETTGCTTHHLLRSAHRAHPAAWLLLSCRCTPPCDTDGGIELA